MAVLVLGFLPLLAPSAGAVETALAPVPAAPVITPTPPRSQFPKFLCLPNGWGNTPGSARRDLDRVMGLYQDKPGFRRFAYYKVVPVGRNSYEADGMCTWDAVDAKIAADPHPARNAR